MSEDCAPAAVKKRRYRVNRRSPADVSRQDSRRQPRRYDHATDALPGSPEKVDVLMSRVRRRLPLHSPGDVISDAGRRLNFETFHRGNRLKVDARDSTVSDDGDGDNKPQKIPGETLGDRLEAARVRAGLTQRALAGRAGISRELVRLIESDDRAPKLLTLCALAVALGVSLHWLATGRAP